MTFVANIPNKLKDYFTLRTIKESVWLDYLCSETGYVNGGVYFHYDMPVYNPQKVDSDVFDVDSTEALTSLTLLIHGTNLSKSQLDKRVITLDGNELSSSYRIITGGTSLFFDTAVDGYLKVIIPPVNERENHYQGIVFSRLVKKQSMTFAGTFTKTDNTLTFSVDIVNPHVGQEVKAVTLYRNGNTNKVKTEVLTENQTRVNFNMSKGNQDVGLRVELVPKTIDGATYTGAMTEISW